MNFVDLPRSIRHQIYSYALDTELVNVGAEPVSYSHSLDNTGDGLIRFQASRSPFPVQTALFRVNRLLSKEALNYFYSKNLFVRLQVFSKDARHAKNMLTESGLLFSTASVESLDKSSGHAMNLVLMEEKSGTRRAVTMFPAQYLPRLVSFLLRASEASKSWASTQSLIAAVENGYEFSKAKLQGDLLEPLRGLSGLESAAIEEKNILPRYAKQLQAGLTGPEPTADAWLKAATEAADAADAARDANEFDSALEYAQTAIITMTSAYLTRAEALHSQGETLAKGMQRLRWRTELGIGVTLSLKHAATTSSRTWLKQKTDASIRTSKDLLLAESSVSKALSLATDSPSPKSNPWFLSVPVEVIPPNKRIWFTDFERAQSWYALGVVHLSLGEHLFGAGDLERALEIWGNEANKDNVEKAFARARAGIDADAEDMWNGAIRPGSGLDEAARLASIEA